MYIIRYVYQGITLTNVYMQQEGKVKKRNGLDV